jgi:hypothetical protein
MKKMLQSSIIIIIIMMIYDKIASVMNRLSYAYCIERKKEI